MTKQRVSKPVSMPAPLKDLLFKGVDLAIRKAHKTLLLKTLLLNHGIALTNTKPDTIMVPASGICMKFLKELEIAT